MTQDPDAAEAAVSSARREKTDVPIGTPPWETGLYSDKYVNGNALIFAQENLRHLMVGTFL